MEAALTLSSDIGIKSACASLDVPRSEFYRTQARKNAPPVVPIKRPSPPRALSSDERQGVLDILYADRFADKAPQEIYATILDEGQYHCSISTMYRILNANQEVKERRNQLSHPVYQKPELLATGPNQVWSWDITKLLGPAKWTYFYLYVILDIFSRYTVGWLIAHRECSELASRLIRETCEKQDVKPDQLTIHSDRGPAMKSQTVAQLLAALGVIKSHSRPSISNDNPFSESQFKTFKYQPDFPNRFASYDEALAYCSVFFDWYNNHHYHSGLNMLTPASVHYGNDASIVASRQQTLEAAYAAHPERFVLGLPTQKMAPQTVWINPPKPLLKTIPDKPNLIAPKTPNTH